MTFAKGFVVLHCLRVKKMVVVCDYVNQAFVIVTLLTPSEEDGCCL